MTRSLPVDALHIWTCRLSDRMQQLTQLTSWVSVDELKRAQQFRFDRDRHAYIVSRATLRQVLAEYLSKLPHELAFRYGEQGKPILSGIEFNLSHSHDYWVLAVTRDTPLGIDVEWIDRTVVSDRLAQTCFSPRELEQFQSVVASERKLAFFQGWTRKEAFIKAIGSGLYFGLKKFSVTLLPQQPARLLEITAEGFTAADWQLYSFSPADDYCGAVAWQGGDKQVVLMEVPCLPQV